MLAQIMLNTGIAFVWILLQNNYTIQSFVVGYLLGMLFLFVFRNQLAGRLYFLPGAWADHKSRATGKQRKRSYIYKTWVALVLLLVFIKDMIFASFVVIVQVLKPKLTVKPGIVRYETDLETAGQITVLTSIITLVPGSVSMQVSPDGKIIYIHVFDIDGEDAFVKDVRERYEKRIKEVVS